MGGDYYLLLRRTEENNSDGNYYYTVRLPQNESAADPQCTISMELGGESYSLSHTLVDPNLKTIGMRTLLHLVVLLNGPIKGLPESVRLQEVDHAEALLYQQGILNGIGDRSVTTDEKVKTELTSRQMQSQNAQMPVRNNFVLSGGYPLPLRAEKPLSDSELTKVADVLKSVPPQLFDVLNKNGMLPPLYFEIVEDDLMNFTYNSGTLGICDRDLKKFYIRRSALHQNQELLQEIVVHELAHGVFPISYWDKKLPSAAYNYFRYGSYFKDEASDCYLILDYWDEAVKKAKVDKDFPGISIYSLNNPAEFFAECSLAYMSGEEDKYPWDDAIHGSKSRSELRQKLPEMYIMLKLFYDSDSPYLGDKTIFQQDAKNTIAFLALDKVALSPQTTGAELAQLFNDIRHMQET